MKIMIETTQWEGQQSPNHIYVFERYHPGDRTAKAIAYVPFGTEPVKRFKKPMMIDLKGRQFQMVD
jgi:hypothetical protein